jgi:hypothetical protein
MTGMFGVVHGRVRQIIEGAFTGFTEVPLSITKGSILLERSICLAKRATKSITKAELSNLI